MNKLRLAIFISVGCFLNLQSVAGEVGKPTDKQTEAILGDDKNHDGVRDDVAKYIDEKYGKSAEQKAALMQFAALLQIEMVEKDSKKEDRLAMDAVACLMDTMKGDAIKAMDDIRHVQVNTAARAKAYLEYQQSGGPRIIEAPSANRKIRSTCKP